MRLALIVATITMALVTQPTAAAPSQQMRPARDPSAQTHAPAAVPGDTLDGKARFPLASLDPPAPTNLTNTNNYAQCTQHGGFGAGLACKSLLPLGRLALVWSYVAGHASVTGFHVYRVDGGQRSLVSSQANGPGVTVFIVDPPPPGGYAGACYAVSAYGGGAEGDLSSPFCAGSGGVVRTLMLAPQQNRGIQRSHVKKTGVNPDDEFVNESEANQVGYFYETQKDPVLGDRSVDTAYRLGLLFDASPLNGRTIISARLKMSVDSTWIDAPFPEPANVSDHHTSCAGKIGVGIDRWWTHSDWIENSIMASPGRFQGPGVSMDVTPIVRMWSSGQPNFGVVLQAEEENFGAFTEASCLTSYVPGSFALEVQYE